MKDTIVIYHKQCTDGFTAAFTLWLKYGDNAEYIAAAYGDSPPPVNGLHVIIVDFSYPRDILLQLEKEALSLKVYDHHKTAQEGLSGLDFAYFDMHRSGAGIAWDVFHTEKRPWIIDYVEDRDLWKWELWMSREINAYISSIPYDFERYKFVMDNVTKMDARLHGEVVLHKVHHYCEEVAKNARLVHFEDYDIPCVNVPQVDCSEVCEYLKEHFKTDISMYWFQRQDGSFQYGLRSNGDLDVSAIAKKYGGGGHKNAAGFQLSYLLKEIHNSYNPDINI